MCPNFNVFTHGPVPCGPLTAVSADTFAVDVFTYFEQKEREIKELSLFPDRDFWRMCAAERGSDDKRGRIFGRFWLTNNAYIQLHEVVVVRGRHVHREEYGYFLVIGGEEVRGSERDPSHDPPVHKHTGADHVREDAEPISFRKFVEEAWDELYELAPQEFSS
jgi:hypothetical protein